MKIRLISAFLCIMLCIGLLPAGVLAAGRDVSRQEVLAAELKQLGLYKGVSDTNFDLERAPTRTEAVVMLIRVLGKESEATSGGWKHPFTDVAAWANPYIGYAYEKGLTSGMSATTFGTGSVTAAQYLTFVLRAMNYSDKEGDFSWNNSAVLAKSIGILPDDVDMDNFWRADMVSISHAALGAKLKGSQQTLAQKLVAAGVFTKAQYDALANKPGQSSEPCYVPVKDVGTYDKSIITDALFSAQSDLPEVTQSKLPTTWQGLGISQNKYLVTEYKKYSEADVLFLERNGFNFARLYLDFNTLRWPDYSADPNTININELLELDQFLAWCIEYDVHVQISMGTYLSADGSIAERSRDEAMPRNAAEWALTRDYWEMLARRYADIPSKYLSFELCNEKEPRKESQYAAAKVGLKTVVDAVWAADPDRVLLYAQNGTSTPAWTEVIASLGIAVAAHVYQPIMMSLLGGPEFDHNPRADVSWPQPYFPTGRTIDGKAKIIFTGAVDGATLRFHVRKSGAKPEVAVYADGKKIDTLKLQGTLDGYDYIHDDIYYSVQIPAGTKKVELQVVHDLVWFDTFIVERNGVETVMLPSDAYGNEDMTMPLPLVIHGDGTYSNTKNIVLDEDFIYENAVKPFRDVAEKYGVGFMINEFGMAGARTFWHIDKVTAYHETYLKMMEKYDIPWCYLEEYNRWPKHLRIISGSESQWEGATVEDVTYTYNDGRTETMKVCRELLDVFLRHTMQ